MVERTVAAGLGALLAAQALCAALEFREPSVATPVAVGSAVACALAVVIALDAWFGARSDLDVWALAAVQIGLLVGLGWFVWFPQVPDEPGDRLAGVGAAGRWTAGVWLVAVVVSLLLFVIRQVPAARRPRVRNAIVAVTVVLAGAVPAAGGAVATVAARSITTAGLVSTTAAALPASGSGPADPQVDPTHVLWSRPVPIPGESSAVLVDGQVLALTYVLGAAPVDTYGADTHYGVVALDAATGAERWRFVVDGDAQLAVSPAEQAVLVLVGDTVVRLDLGTGRQVATAVLPDADPGSGRWDMVTRVDILKSHAADSVLLTGRSVLLEREGPDDPVPSLHRLDLTDGALQPVDVAPSRDCTYRLADDPYFDAAASSGSPDYPATVVRDGRGCGPPQVLRVQTGYRAVFAVPAPADDRACTGGCSLDVVLAGADYVAVQVARDDGPASEVLVLDPRGRVETRISVASPYGGLRTVLPPGPDGRGPRIVVDQAGRLEAVDHLGGRVSAPETLPDGLGPGRTVLAGNDLIGTVYGPADGPVSESLVADNTHGGTERARSAPFGCSAQRISTARGLVLVSCRGPGPGGVSLVMLGLPRAR